MPTSPTVVVGLCRDYRAARVLESPQQQVNALATALAASHPDVHWSVVAVSLGGPDHRPAPTQPIEATALLARGRELLLEHDLDVAVLVTEGPVRLNGRPVAAHASPVQQSIVVSAPALRGCETVTTAAARLVPALLETEQPDAASTRLLAELGATPDAEREGAAFVVHTLLGSPRVLLGMVRANRPWLLAARLSRTLVGAFAAAVIAIVTPDVWMLADRMRPARLGAIGALVLLATCGVLVIGGRLRERAPSRRVRRTVLLHNTAVWLSVGLGVATLYAGLVVASLATTLLVLPWSLVADTVGHPVGWSTMLRVGALASVVALVGSAFGAGLEDDAAVRNATYSGSDDVEYVDT